MRQKATQATAQKFQLYYSPGNQVEILLVHFAFLLLPSQMMPIWADSPKSHLIYISIGDEFFSQILSASRLCSKSKASPYSTSGFFSDTFSFVSLVGDGTSTLPSCLWSLRIFPFLPGSRLTKFYRDASSALLQLVHQWLIFTYSRTHAFRYGRQNKNLKILP